MSYILFKNVMKNLKIIFFSRKSPWPLTLSIGLLFIISIIIYKISNGYLIFLLGGSLFLPVFMINEVVNVSKKKIKSRDYTFFHAKKKTSDKTSSTNHYKQHSVYLCEETGDLIIAEVPLTTKPFSKGNKNDFVGANVEQKAYLATYNLEVKRISTNVEKKSFLTDLVKYNNLRVYPKQNIDFKLLDESIYNNLYQQNYNVSNKPFIDSDASSDIFLQKILDYNLAKEVIEIVNDKID